MNGMPALDTPVSFKILNKGSNPAAQQIEKKYTNGLIPTHSEVNNTFFGKTTTFWVQLKKAPADISSLLAELGYEQEISLVFGPIANDINQNFNDRLQVIEIDNLIEIIT